MEHTDFFKNFCKPEFEEIKATQKDRDDKIERQQIEILDLLKGTNGTAGLCERVRLLESCKRAVWGAVIFVTSITVIQLVEYLAKKLK